MIRITGTIKGNEREWELENKQEEFSYNYNEETKFFSCSINGDLELKIYNFDLEAIDLNFYYTEDKISILERKWGETQMQILIFITGIILGNLFLHH